jgi:hypothetical protein
MTDPVTEVVSLLKPSPSISKLVTGGGQWLVERTELGSPFYCAVVEGRCLMTIAGRDPMVLTAGDFVLVPKIFSFTMSSMEPPPRGGLAQRLRPAPASFAWATRKHRQRSRPWSGIVRSARMTRLFSYRCCRKSSMFMAKSG